jgi:hypothetical protein
MTIMLSAVRRFWRYQYCSTHLITKVMHRCYWLVLGWANKWHVRYVLLEGVRHTGVHLITEFEQHTASFIHGGVNMFLVLFIMFHLSPRILPRMLSLSHSLSLSLSLSSSLSLYYSLFLSTSPRIQLPPESYSRPESGTPRPTWNIRELYWKTETHRQKSHSTEDRQFRWMFLYTEVEKYLFLRRKKSILGKKLEILWHIC